MKLDKTFRMPKEWKRLLASTRCVSERIMYKHMLLDAYVYSELAKQKTKDKKEKEQEAA